MNIVTVSPSNQDRYNAFVAQNNGSFLQSWEWGNWQERNKRQVTRYMVKDESGTPMLCTQFIRHTLPFGKEYLYCAYGPVLDESRFQNQELSKILEELIGKIHKDYPEAIFIRLESTFNFQLSTFNLTPTLHIQPGSTILLDITKPSEKLLANMHPKTRYNIKVAEKHGVHIQRIESGEEKQLAANMLQNTLTRRKLASPNANYYHNLANYQTDSNNFTVNTFGAFLKDQLLACALTIDFHHTRTYLFGGSSTEHKNVMAPYLLHWTIIQDAKENKLETYDWFGAEGAVSDGSGFARFKTGFGGNLKEYDGAYDIVFSKLSYKLYQLTRTLNRWVKHL